MHLRTMKPIVIMIQITTRVRKYEIIKPDILYNLFFFIIDKDTVKR